MDEMRVGECETGGEEEDGRFETVAGDDAGERRSDD